MQRAHVDMCLMCVCVYVFARADVQALQMGRVSRCVGVCGVCGVRRVIGDQAVPGQEPTALAGVGVPFGFALYETKSRELNL